jgi:hypothetical protein
MRDSWYSDDRDVVKWGGLVHLATREQLGAVVQVAMFRPGKRVTLDTMSGVIAVPEAVWAHFRDLRGIRVLGEAVGLEISIIDEPFASNQRGVYFKRVAETLRRVPGRFGSSSRHRRRLALRLRRWIELGRQVGATRLLVDGSFVTAKEEPQDVDTVILLPQDFAQQLEQENPPALELEEMLLTRRPEEIFAAEDETDWEEWVEFFSLTRESDRCRKGLVEIPL